MKHESLITEQYFPGGAVYFAVQGGLSFNFESVVETLKCDHSNERLALTFESVGKILKGYLSKASLIG